MKTSWQIVRKPVQLFALTAVGLCSALVSDGGGDVVGWACLMYVVGVALRHAFTIGRE